MVNEVSGRCLEAKDGSLFTRECERTNDLQKWLVHREGLLVNNVGSNTVLDSNAVGSAYALPKNGGEFQNWERFPP